MKKPNILLIHVDQHRWDCLGCQGNPDVKTPNLDALSKDGVRYTQHYTVYPVCTPSRYSMLSGQYVRQHNAWSNESTLPPAIPTFPKLLRSAGYRTAAVGKMHFTPTYQDVGFDHMVLCEQNGRGRYEDDYHAWLMEEGLTDNLDLTDQTGLRDRASDAYYKSFGAFASDLDLSHHSTSWITDKAAEQINSWEEEGGNLLMAGYVKPHHPFDPPKPYSERYNPDTLSLPPGYTPDVPDCDYRQSRGFFDNRELTEDRLRHVLAMYYGTITQIDDGVGRLIQLLKKKGFYDNTMIIYTSDHGEYLGYHHMLLKSNFLYDPLARIPLLIKYPKCAGVQTGAVDDTLSENIDLSSTILSGCGIRQPVSMCGRSLLPDPGAGEPSAGGREYVFSEGRYGDENRPVYGYMLRSRHYKLIVHGSLDNCMFFDLERDPFELTNEIHNPALSDEIARHKAALIDRLLFKTAGSVYCDPCAPQRASQDLLDHKSREVGQFISEYAQPF